MGLKKDMEVTPKEMRALRLEEKGAPLLSAFNYLPAELKPTAYIVKAGLTGSKREVCCLISC